ncbi:MAG: glycogen-binding domain-containing protein [Elusimicrobiota bacterium]
MIDRFGGDKRVFWALALALLALILAPSAVLLRAARGYYRFLTGFEPGTLRPSRVNYLPRHEDPGPAQAPRLHFIEFRLKAPKAKRVELLGDFNGWKAGTLLLTHEKGGDWEMMLPLPPGRYRYLFTRDGESVLDPESPAEGAGENKASIRSVP